MLRRTQLPRLFMQASFSSRRAQAASASSSVSRLHDLPRLPVPGLHQTLQKYLKSLEPFLLEDEARGGPSFREAYEKRAEWVEDFERGIGAGVLMALFWTYATTVALDRASPTNWLDDNFWMKKAYHEWRAPLLVNSNWWLAFHNDPNVPEDVIHGRITTRNIGYTDWQVRRASWLVHRILEWKARLERQDCHSDNTRAGIWLRDTAGKMFNIARLPRPGSDTLSPFPIPGDHDARKLIVHAHDWLYAIEVLDENMQSLPPALIERRLKAIVADVERRLARGERAVPVSVLTTDERDRWTENQDHLLSLSPINHSILRTINRSLFALSLDHYTYVLPPASSDAKLLLPEPCTIPDITAHLHNVRSGPSTRPGHNRWYDKPFTLIVESNTRAGALGEHSPCDALVPSIAAEYAVVEAIDGDAFVQSERLDNLSTGWERLDWVVDERIQRECAEAERRAKRIVDDSDDGILWFDAYGAEWIRDVARLSPDAYIQMALQLAWYRTRGCFTATYETALTRLFKNGRTETIRTLTTDSRAFVLTMTDPHSLARTRHELLLRAVKTHTNLTRHAATGRGIDRHLLGLQMMLRSSDEEHHILFDDELFTRSQTWKLSTSGLSAGHQFRGTGFGAAYPDGYGINYLADSAMIKFGIESKFSGSQTSTELFKSAITEALEDLRSLCTNVLTAHL